MTSTKDKILKIALHLFAQSGFDAVSTSQIADALSITKGADEKDMMTKKFNGMLPQQKKVIDEQAGGVKDIKASEAKINDKKDKATVEVTVTFNKEFNGKSSKVETVNLKKVKDNWKVSIL